MIPSLQSKEASLLGPLHPSQSRYAGQLTRSSPGLSPALPLPRPPNTLVPLRRLSRRLNRLGSRASAAEALPVAHLSLDGRRGPGHLHQLHAHVHAKQAW